MTHEIITAQPITIRQMVVAAPDLFKVSAQFLLARQINGARKASA